MVQMAFRSTGTQKIFQKTITQQSIVEEDLLWPERRSFSSSRKFKLQFVNGWQKAADWVKMLVNLFLTQEGCHLCGEEWIFQQDNAAILNAPITKKYLLEQKIRLLDHPACSPDLNPIENFWRLIVAKVCEGVWWYSAISEPKNTILETWEKIPSVQL